MHLFHCIEYLCYYSTGFDWPCITQQCNVRICQMHIRMMQISVCSIVLSSPTKTEMYYFCDNDAFLTDRIGYLEFCTFTVFSPLRTHTMYQTRFWYVLASMAFAHCVYKLPKKVSIDNFVISKCYKAYIWTVFRLLIGTVNWDENVGSDTVTVFVLAHNKIFSFWHKRGESIISIIGPFGLLVLLFWESFQMWTALHF